MDVLEFKEEELALIERSLRVGAVVARIQGHAEQADQYQAVANKVSTMLPPLGL